MNLGQIAVLVWVIEKLSPKKEKPVKKITTDDFERIPSTIWEWRITTIIFLIAVVAAIAFLFSGRFFSAFLLVFFGLIIWVLPLFKYQLKKQGQPE